MIRQQMTSPFFASIKSSNRSRTTISITHSASILRSQLNFFLGIFALFICVVQQVSADSYLPLIGGSGGNKFQSRCPQGQYGLARTKDYALPVNQSR
jgi:hypothetical protein